MSKPAVPPCRLTRCSRSCRPGRPARFEISGNLEIQKSKILKSLSQGFGQVQNSGIFVARATQNVKILSNFLGDMFQKYGGHFYEKKSACGNVGGHPGLAEILYGGLAVPLDPLQQVMQTRSTRYDPGGPLGICKKRKMRPT